MKRFGVAKFGYVDRTPLEIYEQIDDMLFSEDAEFAREQAELVKEMMEFEELRGDRDMIDTIKYTIKFGDLHLINTTHRSGFIPMTDIDIKVCFCILSFLIYVTFDLLCCASSDFGDEEDEK